MRRLRQTVPLLALAFAAACDPPGPAPRLAEGVTREGLTSRLERFVPVEIDAPTREVEPWERAVLARLVRASEAMHELFLRQMAGGLPALRDALAASDSAWAPAAAAYFDRMAGPWDRLAGDAPFLDVGPRPAGGGFYPEDLTSSDLDAWLREHPEDREAFTDPFSVVRREHATLIAVPYSAEYRETVGRVADLLRDAASSSHSPSLRRYLEARASAVAGAGRSAGAADGASVEGTRIEAAIGPYGRAEDRLWGAKAAFTGVVALVDSAATHRFDETWADPPAVAPAPIAAGRDGPARRPAGPVRVVDLVHAGGAARAGVHTVALAVAAGAHAGEGARTLVFRNVARAKFEHVLVPLAGVVLGPPEASALRFDPWFTVLLLREASRAVEPPPGLPGVAASTPAAGLGRDRAMLEEARAAAMGLAALEAAAVDGRYPEASVRSAYAAHLADLFRAARFGPADPRAEAAALQFGWAWERQAIQFNEEYGAFTFDRAAFAQANRELAAEILRVQAESDDVGAAALRDRYGEPRPELADFLPRLASLPVDIRPQYVAAARVLDEARGR